MAKVKPIPDNCHTLNIYLTVKNASEAVEWYKKAFNAQEIFRMPGPGGKVMHAELRIGDSTLMLADEFPEMKAHSPQTIGDTATTVMMYVENVDQIFNQAVKAGAHETMPVKDQFWGDRYGQLKDPYGHKWAIATHVEDVPPEEMKKRHEEMVKQMAAAHK